MVPVAPVGPALLPVLVVPLPPVGPPLSPVLVVPLLPVGVAVVPIVILLIGLGGGLPAEAGGRQQKERKAQSSHANLDAAVFRRIRARPRRRENSEAPLGAFPQTQSGCGSLIGVLSIPPKTMIQLEPNVIELIAQGLTPVVLAGIAFFALHAPRP